MDRKVLTPLHYKFINKPLLIGGKAKEYYGIRKAGADIDFVVSRDDYRALSDMYPDNLKDLFGDLGIVKDDLEVWQSICLFDYDFLSEGAIDNGDYLIISLEKLLFLTALGMKKEKYMNDLKLLVEKILDNQYRKSGTKTKIAGE